MPSIKSFSFQTLFGWHAAASSRLKVVHGDRVWLEALPLSPIDLSFDVDLLGDRKTLPGFIGTHAAPLLGMERDRGKDDRFSQYPFGHTPCLD